MGLASAEGKKLERFKITANNIFISTTKNLLNPLKIKVMPIFYFTGGLSKCIQQYLWREAINSQLWGLYYKNITDL
jgi:hypothetical protein